MIDDILFKEKLNAKANKTSACR